MVFKGIDGGEESAKSTPLMLPAFVWFHLLLCGNCASVAPMISARLAHRKVYLLKAMAFFFCAVVLTSCGRRKTLVEIGDREQVFRVCDGVEPSDLDPQTAIGQGEHDVMLSLFEGLVTADPKDVS